MSKPYKILAINTGSTSTKLALYEGETELFKSDVSIPVESLKQYKLMIDQLDLRMEGINAFLKEAGVDVSKLDMIAARGGSINGLHSGAYKVDEHMVTVARYAQRSQHASTLSCCIAKRLGDPYGVPAIIYDSVAASDADPLIEKTGLPGVNRFVTCHMLNQRMVGRETAARLGKPYEKCNFIIAHLGGGITIGLHQQGRVTDTVLDDAGPMSPQRAGRLPVTSVIGMCFEEGQTKLSMQSRVRGRGGLVAYFGTDDVRKVEQMIAEGNQEARDIYWLMSYQLAKSIAELAVPVKGQVDAIILTGGIAYSQMFTQWVKEQVAWLAPVEIVPGEREMLALMRGATRVLDGEEVAQDYRWLPEGCESLEQLVEQSKGLWS